MFLIKDEEILNYVSQGPNKTYEKFAQSVHSLCGNKVTIQEIWSIYFITAWFCFTLYWPCQQL